MTPVTLSHSPHVVRVHDLPGTGTPIVFLHGLGCASSCDYPRVVRDPSLASRRAVLLDLLGAGYSDKPADFGYSMADHARVVAQVVDRLGLQTLALYGHSMGGAVAIEVAAMLSSRVEHLVLSEPNLDAGGGEFSRAIAAQPEDEYVARGHAEAIRSASAAGNHVWAGSMATTAPVAVHRAAASLVRGGQPSWRATLLGLSASRTVLFGARSLPDEDFVRLPSHGIEVATLADAGHSMAWENPSGLAQAIAEACRRH